MKDVLLGAAVASLMCACSAAPPPVAKQAPPLAARKHATPTAPSKPVAAAKAKAAPVEAKPALPTLQALEASCAGKKKCTPSEEVAARLCSHRDPDLALAMFRRGTPWKRVYSRGDFESWYAKKGRTRPRHVRYAEELLVMVDRTDAGGGMSVSGFGNYDVYRMDGTCVSMMADEVTNYRPGTPDVATVPWRKLKESTQDALTKNKRIAFRNSLRKRDCKGRAKRNSDECKLSTHDLSRVIAEHLWSGGTIPVPQLLP